MNAYRRSMLIACVLPMHRFTGAAASGVMSFVLALASMGCERADSAQPPTPPPARTSNSGNADSMAGSADNAVATSSASSSRAGDPFASVLTQVVSEEGLVRYALLAGEEVRKQLDSAIDAMAAASPPGEDDVASRKALWINAFNANVLRMAADEHSKAGFKTVHDVPGFFDQKTVKVAGEELTLNALRDRLRQLRDPRIHSALVLAAKGSPPLRDEPFAASQIDQQLDNQSLVWLDDQADNRAARDGLWLSTIFEEFASDFEVEPYKDVLGFVRKHSRPNGGIRDFVRSVSNIRIRHREFDWTLNDAGE